MKIKQTIKKIEEEIERLKRNSEIKRKFGTPTAQFDFNIRVVEGKLSGYKLALKDVLSEIDEDFELLKKVYCKDWVNNQCNYKKGCEECNKIDKFKEEELKKPIQEILKDRIVVLK